MTISIQDPIYVEKNYPGTRGSNSNKIFTVLCSNHVTGLRVIFKEIKKLK